MTGMRPKTAPAWVKTSLKRRFAIERLRKAAQAFLDEETEHARSSFQEPGEPWSDAMWRRGHRESARLAIELRRALKEVAACAPKP